MINNIGKSNIELIPDSPEKVCKVLDFFRSKGINFDGVNLPDLVKNDGSRVNLSPEQFGEIKKILKNEKLIGHLRTRDSDSIKSNIDRATNLFENSVDEILLVTGDKKDFNNSKNIITTSDTLEVLGKNKNGKISVAADLYFPEYGNFNKKINYLLENPKTNIYTQPIFNIKTLDEFINYLEKKGLKIDNNLFGGITTIGNKGSRTFWNITNKISLDLLPKGESDNTILENSKSQAIEVLKYLKENHFSTYNMLMREKPDNLFEVINRAENLL